MPGERGVKGGGANPEQFFVAGFAARLHRARGLLALCAGAAIPDADVTSSVTFGRSPVDGLHVLVTLIRASLPDVGRAPQGNCRVRADLPLCEDGRFRQQVRGHPWRHDSCGRRRPPVVFSFVPERQHGDHSSTATAAHSANLT